MFASHRPNLSNNVMAAGWSCVFPPCSAGKAPTGCALLGCFFFFIIYCSSPFFSRLTSPLLVLMLEELVATDGNHRDECHELLEVTLCVTVGVQALHQAVEGCLVFHVLQGRTEKFTSGRTKLQTIKGKKFR